MSFSPAKLFNDDTTTSNGNGLSPHDKHDKNTDNGQEAHGLVISETACTYSSPLAPSLEPNTTSASTTHTQIEPGTKTEATALIPALAPVLVEDEVTEEVIPMDILLSEIQRLITHEFGGPTKAAPYPSVLKPLYQRMQDYHVLLKNARRKLDQHQQQRVHSSPAVGVLSAGSEASSNKLNIAATASTAVNNTQLAPSPVSTPVAARLLMKHDNLLEISTATVASTSNNNNSTSAMGLDHSQSQGTIVPQLQERISDLEQQLAQSRRAHHTLLQDHILNLKKTSSHFLIGPGVTAKLPKADARAIHGILASVNCESDSLVLPSGSSPSSSSSGKSKKKKKESSSLKKESGLGGASGTLDIPKDTFQETIQTARDLHERHIRQLKGISSTSPSSSSSAPPSATFGESNNLSTTLLTSDSEPCLVAVSSQQLMSEATTRLLRAETELGLLKLVMAQNQEEISGLEEDVFRAQRELKNHRKVFESLLELHQLGFEVQIREDQLQIKSLEEQIKKTDADKVEAEKLVKKLEQDLEEKEKVLNQKRDTYQRQEQDIKDGPVRDLEAEIELLKGELKAQEFRLGEMEQQAIVAKEEDNQMVEHLDRQHRKATAALKASLFKAQRTNIRLNKDVSTLTKKMIAVESLNEEHAQQTKRDRAQLADLQRQTEELQAQLDSTTSSSSVANAGSSQASIDQQNEMKATIAALEIQIEDLSSSLRLKEEELEQALEETEHLALKLEQDLALQQEAHKVEMAKFAEEKKIQAQRERACQSTSVILFQNMVTKLQTELGETQEKLRDTTLCWGHTKEQLQKCEQSYRRRKKDLEETTKNLHELEETMAKLGDAIGMLEYEKEANGILVRTLEERDREIRDMEYRLKVLEEERD
ncbi:hypothetical protein EC991_004096 [Linnemannia zychae]|nr:hypothetical protein EC991_004096 [Linnemannia zychae]